MENDKLGGVYLWLVLWRASRTVEQYAFKSILEMGLGLDCVSDFAVLEILMRSGPLPVNEIGKQVILKSASMTVAVDRLEKKGLVERKNHAKDRRARIVHLTAKGEKLIKKAWKLHATDLEKLTASLSEKERKNMMQVLRQLTQNAAALLEEPKKS